jgi:hypothetical protein
MEVAAFLQDIALPSTLRSWTWTMQCHEQLADAGVGALSWRLVS